MPPPVPAHLGRRRAIEYGVYVTTTSTATGFWTRDGALLRSPLLDSLGVAAGFTTRAFGSMGDAKTPLDVQRAHRAALAEQLGFNDVVRTRQVHGTEVVRLDAPVTPWPEADALWSDQRGVLLGIVAADCVPVFVADRQGGPFGLAHAGWRGSSLGVARALIRAMVAGGSDPNRLVAALGPSIGPCCYTIDGERVELVRARLGRGNDDIVAGGRMDLWLANERQLREEGVETVEVSRICTRCGGEDVWSYRGRTPERDYGTCLAFIGWPAEEARA
jgi:YfiH family protein